MPGPVTIRIPADTAHVALVRAAATALAARMDFTFDRITDLHIAVDEVCSRLMAVSVEPTTIEVTFRTEGDALTMQASIDGTRRTDRDMFTEWSRVILEAIADRVVAPGGSSVEVALSRGDR